MHIYTAIVRTKTKLPILHHIIVVIFFFVSTSIHTKSDCIFWVVHIRSVRFRLFIVTALTSLTNQFTKFFKVFLSTHGTYRRATKCSLGRFLLFDVFSFLSFAPETKVSSHLRQISK